MYEISKSCVKVSNGITDFFPIKVGVKQGDNLSPNLFKIFINDFPDYIENCPDQVLPACLVEDQYFGFSWVNCQTPIITITIKDI
jgi:hypothetical protein